MDLICISELLFSLHGEYKRREREKTSLNLKEGKNNDGIGHSDPSLIQLCLTILRINFKIFIIPGA